MIHRLGVIAAGLALGAAVGLVSLGPPPPPAASPAELVASMEPPVLLGGRERTSMVVMGTGADEALVPAAGVAAYRAYLNEKAGISGRCGTCPRVVVLDASVMPYITRNVKLAVSSGKPSLLTKADDFRQRANRKAACGGFTYRHPRTECDEYPFASTAEGGAGSRTEEVPMREQRCQGGTMGRQYTKQGIVPGAQFHVAILNQQFIASGPYAGTDTAKVKGPC